MTLQDLTVNFRHLDRQQLLSDWEWRIGTTKLPILITATGDAFLQDASDGTVHFLDVGAGQVSAVAPSPTAFQALLTTPEFRKSYFAPQLVGDLRKAGQPLSYGLLYSPIVPPLLGGEYCLENLKATPIEAHFSLAGKLHRQLASVLPPSK